MADHGRASAIIGAGTLVSRVTGLIRSVVLVAVVGISGSDIANAFATANLLPTNIYELLAAGVITGIIVPQIMRAAQHRDGGNAYISKLLTLGSVLLVVATAVVMAIAPFLIWMLTPGYTPEQQALTLALAYWCLPQLLFYGLYALIGEVLNARRVFGPYSWAPTLNNIVSIAGFGVFLVIFGGPFTRVSEWEPAMTTVLGATATLGIALQAGVLAFFWRRTGLKVRLDFGWRGMGLRHLGTLGFWTFLTVVAGQVAGFVQQAVMSTSSEESGLVVFTYAWLIFMLPHSIVAMSISTSYFTQLADDVARGRGDLVGANLDESIRALSIFAVGLTAAIGAASVPIARIFEPTSSGAVILAVNVCAFLIALVPFGILVLVRRAFFAFHDTRTPFWFTVVQAALAIIGAAGAFAASSMGLLPLALLTSAVALAQSLSMFVQLPLALRLLRRHTGPISLAPTWRALGRFVIAALPALLGGIGVFMLTGGIDGWTTSGMLGALLGATLVGGVALVVYVGGLALLRAPELDVALRGIRRIARR